MKFHLWSSTFTYLFSLFFYPIKSAIALFLSRSLLSLAALFCLQATGESKEPFLWDE